MLLMDTIPLGAGQSVCIMETTPGFLCLGDMCSRIIGGSLCIGKEK